LVPGFLAFGLWGREPGRDLFSGHAREYVPVGLGSSHPWLETVLKRDPGPALMDSTDISTVATAFLLFQILAHSYLLSIMPARAPSPMYVRRWEGKAFQNRLWPWMARAEPYRDVFTGVF
jgi:hypothetical protein